MEKIHSAALFISISAVLKISCLMCSAVGPDTTYSNISRTIQFNIKPLLNARAVTTFANGKLISWKKGIDGEWSGLATRTAADKMGSIGKIALPDDGIFEANGFHPRVILNFSNEDTNNNQVRFTDRNVADRYSFNVAENYYVNISMFFMSAFGTSDFTIEISYSDNTSEIRKCKAEDWATALPESETKYFLCANLAKWSNKNAEMEKDNHYLMGIDVKPSPGKKVVKIAVNKPASPTSLTFWGATGYGASSEAWTIQGNSPFISYEGRIAIADNSVVRLGYPGIVIRINFSGTALNMITRTNSEELYLDVITDGSSPVFLKVPEGESEVKLAQGLKAGDHKISVYKRVESIVGILDIVSLSVTGDFLPSTPLPSRKLLFMGDSFTAGQATTVEDGGPIDPSKAMRQNARLCYGRLIAEKLNAQCHIIAYAGRGVVRDWQGISAVRCAPEYYEYALPDDPLTKWDPNKYVPDVIGICLGNNDFGVGIPDQTSYIAAYTEFIRKIRRDAPDAFIMLITSPSLTDDPGKVPMHTVQKAYLDEIAGRLGDKKVQVVSIAHYEGVPGDWHPSGTAHRAVAAELETVIIKAMNW